MFNSGKKEKRWTRCKEEFCWKEEKTGERKHSEVRQFKVRLNWGYKVGQYNQPHKVEEEIFEAQNKEAPRVKSWTDPSMNTKKRKVIEKNAGYAGPPAISRRHAHISDAFIAKGWGI